MDYCNGPDLKEYMELKNYNLNPEEIQNMTRQISQGVLDMHESLVIHRDLKLQNVIFHFPDDE